EASGLQPLQLPSRLGVAGRAGHVRARLHALRAPRPRATALPWTVRGGRALPAPSSARAVHGASPGCGASLSRDVPGGELAAGVVGGRGDVHAPGHAGPLSLRAAPSPARGSAPAA